MNIKPFIILGTTQCESLSRSLGPVVEAWAGDWFSTAPKPVLRVTPPYDQINALGQLDGWRFSDAGNTDEAVCAIDREARERLLSMLLCHPDGPCRLSGRMRISTALIQGATEDLIARLLSKPGEEYCLVGQDTVGNFVGHATAGPGKDEFHLTTDLDGVVIHLWLPVQPFLPRICSPLPSPDHADLPLTHPKEVLGGQVLDFDVRLGNSELPLGTISRLKVGDVIRLDKDLQDPLYMVFNKSPAKFACYLGQQDDRYALRVESLISG